MAPSAKWNEGLDTGRKIYIGNLDPTVTSQVLQDLFVKFGNVQTIWVARSPPGFAFVTFDDPRDAEDAVKEKDGTKVNDKHIRVEIARGPRPGKEEGGRGGGYYSRGAPWPPHSDNERYRGGRRDDDDHHRRRFEDEEDHHRRRWEDDETRAPQPSYRGGGGGSGGGGGDSRVSDGLYRSGGVYGDSSSRRKRRSPSYGQESGDDVTRSMRGGRDRDRGFRERDYMASSRGGRDNVYPTRDEAADFRRRAGGSDDDGPRSAGVASNSHRAGMAGGSGVGRYYRRSPHSHSASRSRTPPRGRGGNDGLGISGGPPMGGGIVGVGGGVNQDSRERMY